MGELAIKDTFEVGEGRWEPEQDPALFEIDDFLKDGELAIIEIDNSSLRQVEDFFGASIEEITVDYLIDFVREAEKNGQIDDAFICHFGFCNMPFLLDLKFKSTKNLGGHRFLQELCLRLGENSQRLMSSFFSHDGDIALKVIDASREEIPWLLEWSHQYQEWKVQEDFFLMEQRKNRKQKLIETQKTEGQSGEGKYKSFVSDLGNRAPYLMLREDSYSLNFVRKKHIQKFAKAVKTRIDKELEPVIEQFRGFYPIGGKIHFPESISEEEVDRIAKEFGFHSTPFKMLHANKSIILPPCESAVQLQMIIEALARTGVLDPNKNPDLQFSIPGRLNNEYTGILTSSLIFNSRRCVEYPLDSFSTSHDSSTGARIAAYDAGVLDTNFPYMPEGIPGRTDVLMRHDIQDGILYQILGSLVSQAAWGGVFQDIGRAYVGEYKKLLQTYDMEHILTEPWVYDSEKDTDYEAGRHHALVKSCTDSWFSDVENFQKTGDQAGIRYDAKRLLLTKYLEKMKMRQKEVFGDTGLLMETKLLTNI